MADLRRMLLSPISLLLAGLVLSALTVFAGPLAAVAGVMDGQRTKAVHRIEVRDTNGTTSTAVLDIKYHRMTVCPPIGKDQRYGPLELTVIHATERGTPATPARRALMLLDRSAGCNTP